MVRCQVITTWIDADGLMMADAALRYPGAWSDATGQPDDVVITLPDEVTFTGVIDDAAFAALSSDPAITVLSSETISEG